MTRKEEQQQLQLKDQCSDMGRCLAKLEPLYLLLLHQQSPVRAYRSLRCPPSRDRHPEVPSGRAAVRASSSSSTRQEGDENAIKKVRKQEPAHCLSRRPSSFFFSHSSLQSRPTIAWPSHVRLDPLSALGPALPLNPPRRREVQTDASRPPRTRTLSKKRPARTTSSSCVCVPRRCSSSAAFPPA